MKTLLLPLGTTLLFAAAAVVAGWSWLTGGPGRVIEERVEFPASEIPVFRPALPGELTVGAGTPAADLPGSWPMFRGPDGDGVSREEVALAEAWPAEGPPVLWSVELGEGYAGAAVHAGRVYVLDYDEGRGEGEVVPERRGDVLRCLSLADGAEIWRRWYHLPMVRFHGISRTVPAVTDKYVVTLGPMGHVLCLDAVTGEAKWSKDLVAEYGTVIPEWYAGQCPRIDEFRRGREVAILQPGGDQDVLMVALDCETGEEVWRTPNPDGLDMTHASIARMVWNGMRTYVCCTTGGVVAVSARDGKVVWTYPDWRISPAVVPTPVILGENRVLLSGGYKAGGVLLELRANDAQEPEPHVVAKFDVRTMSAEQQTPIAFEDRIYVVLTKNAGPNREQLQCLSSEGAVLWSSGPDRLFELGPFLVADGKLLLCDDEGVLTMVRPSGSGYEELARADVLDGHEAWAPMAIAGGRLLVRDLRTLVCLDLRAEGN